MLDILNITLPEITEEEIDIGLIEQFFKELPDKVFRLGIRVLLAIVVFFVGTRLIKLVRKMVKKSLLRGNAEQGVIQFIDSFIKAALYIVLILFIASNPILCLVPLYCSSGFPSPTIKYISLFMLVFSNISPS